MRETKSKVTAPYFPGDSIIDLSAVTTGEITPPGLWSDLGRQQKSEGLFSFWYPGWEILVVGKGVQKMSLFAGRTKHRITCPWCRQAIEKGGAAK